MKQLIIAFICLAFVAEINAGQCKDTNLKDGTYLKDQYGDGCNSYEGEFVHICGDYDGGSGFKAKTMCCVCGGGSTGEAYACTQPKDRGTSVGNIKRFYYDTISGQCKEFSWSGLDGNHNRFLSKADCEKRCKGPEKTPAPAETTATPAEAIATPPATTAAPDCKDNPNGAVSTLSKKNFPCSINWATKGANWCENKKWFKKDCCKTCGGGDTVDSELEGYTSSGSTGACCTKNEQFHMRCNYWRANDNEACKKQCDQDRNCKGFSMLAGNSCHIATTSSPCPGPGEGTGPWNEGNKGALDSEAKCQHGDFRGCFIKNA